MALDYPLLSWVMTNDSGSKNVIRDGELPTEADEWGHVETSEFERPIPQMVFELQFAPKWKWLEVRTAWLTRGATYTLNDEEGDEYSGRIIQYSAPKERGTPLRHITITMEQDPEDA